METYQIDYTKIDNIVIGDLDTTDYPDFSDAYIESADYDGQPMSEEMLEEVNNNKDYIHESVFNYIF
jgi:hypothetical protein